MNTTQVCTIVICVEILTDIDLYTTMVYNMFCVHEGTGIQQLWKCNTSSEQAEISNLSKLETDWKIT